MLAQTFGIQGIPAVKAFRDGRVVAEFVGAQPPLAVERFLDALVPSEADELVAAGDEASLRRAVELEPSRADAAVPLARLLHGRGDTDGALALLKRRARQLRRRRPGRADQRSSAAPRRPRSSRRSRRSTPANRSARSTC